MPSKGSKKYNQEYINTFIDEILEILAKYRNSHHAMLCGDMNDSVHSSKTDERDKLFMEFCEQQEIYLVDKYPQISTYVHENGLKKSQIDYILSDQQIRSHIESIDILTNQSTHTSDHNPILTTLNIDMDKKKQDCL